VDGRDLADAVGPVPVRQDVRHGKVRPPARLVKVKPVLLEPGEVNDAEVRTARRRADLADFLQFLFRARLFGRIGELMRLLRSEL
jgi:hypothetical protein